MNGNKETNVVRNDLLSLYKLRKHELDPEQIQKIERQITHKLKTWRELLRKSENMERTVFDL